MVGNEPAGRAGAPGQGPLIPGPDVQKLQQVMGELTRLLEAAAGADEFGPAFLAHAVSATGAAGGALWGRGPDGAFVLQHAARLDALGLDAVGGRDAHAGLLDVAGQRGKPLWVPPQGGPAVPAAGGLAANLTGYALLIAPVLVEQQVVGAVEVWFPPPVTADARRYLGQLLVELTGFLAAFLHKSRWRQLTVQQHLWERLEGYTEQIHGSLDPREVAYLVANEGRRLLECDQLAVALAPAGRAHVAAVSGAPAVDKRAKLIAALRTLCDCVLAWGETLVYAGARDESLPPAVLAALDVYLAESNSKVLVAMPLQAKGAEPGGPRRQAVLVAEAFGPAATAEALLARMAVVGKPAAAALHNALAYHHLPLRWLTGPLARLTAAIGGPARARFALAGAALLVAAGLLTFVPAALRLEATGQVLPQERQIVHAPLNGKIVDVKVHPGDAVEKGQELLFIEDLETQLQADQLTLRIQAAEQRIAFLNEHLGKGTAADKQDALVKDRIDQEYEMRKAMAERDILLTVTRSPRKAAVLAPAAGKVVTYDVRETLLGKAVKPGDPLLRVAQVRGAWEISLYLPDAHVSPVREGLARSPDGAVGVDLLLTSHPHRTYKGRLTRAGLGGETTVKDGAVVLPTRVEIVDPDLLPQLEDLAVGVEVRAKVNCGPRAAGYVWFHEFWDFVYEHLLF